MTPSGLRSIAKLAKIIQDSSSSGGANAISELIQLQTDRDMDRASSLAIYAHSGMIDRLLSMLREGAPTACTLLGNLTVYDGDLKDDVHVPTDLVAKRGIVQALHFYVKAANSADADRDAVWFLSNLAGDPASAEVACAHIDQTGILRSIMVARVLRSSEHGNVHLPDLLYNCVRYKTCSDRLALDVYGKSLETLAILAADLAKIATKSTNDTLTAPQPKPEHEAGSHEADAKTAPRRMLDTMLSVLLLSDRIRDQVVDKYAAATSQLCTTLIDRALVTTSTTTRTAGVTFPTGRDLYQLILLLNNAAPADSSSKLPVDVAALVWRVLTTPRTAPLPAHILAKLLYYVSNLAVESRDMRAALWIKRTTAWSLPTPTPPQASSSIMYLVCGAALAADTKSSVRLEAQHVLHSMIVSASNDEKRVPACLDVLLRSVAAALVQAYKSTDVATKKDALLAAIHRGAGLAKAAIQHVQTSKNEHRRRLKCIAAIVGTPLVLTAAKIYLESASTPWLCMDRAGIVDLLRCVRIIATS